MEFGWHFDIRGRRPRPKDSRSRAVWGNVCTRRIGAYSRGLFAEALILRFSVTLALLDLARFAKSFRLTEIALELQGAERSARRLWQSVRVPFQQFAFDFAAYMPFFFFRACVLLAAVVHGESWQGLTRIRRHDGSVFAMFAIGQ